MLLKKYNLDNDKKTLDSDTINLFIKQEYLNKNTIELQFSICKYLSKGDLASDTGFIL